MVLSSLVSKKLIFERLAREAVDLCLRELKESNKSKLTATYTVSQEQCIDHIPYFLFELSRAVLR